MVVAIVVVVAAVVVAAEVVVALVAGAAVVLTAVVAAGWEVVAVVDALPLQADNRKTATSRMARGTMIFFNIFNSF